MSEDLKTPTDGNQEGTPPSQPGFLLIVLKELGRQIKTLFPSVLKYYALPILLLGVLTPYNFTEEGRAIIAGFTRDPLAIMDAQFYTGFISNIGVLAWCVCASLCLFTAAVLRKNSANNEWVSFIAYAGFLTAFLGLDDLFMLHERAFPTYLGIDETILFPSYVFAVGYFLVRYRSLIVKTDFVFLFISCGFFASAIFIDSHIVFPKASFMGAHLFEDGFKFLGIMGWSFYFLRICTQKVRHELKMTTS